MRILRRPLVASFVATLLLSATAILPALAAGTGENGFAASDFATGFASTGSGVGPVGVAFDASGNLFAMDYANGILYKFPSTGGVASAATALNNSDPIPGAPAGIAFTSDGRLYLVRQSADDLVELNPSTGAIIRTVDTGLPCATGIAVDPASGDLFVSELGCGPIVKISNFASGTGTVTTYSSAGDIDGLAFGPDGTLYAAVFGNCVDKIAGTGSVSPAPGTVITQVCGIPGADGSGVAVTNTFIAVNQNNGDITKVDFSTSTPTLTTIVTGGTRGDFVTVGPDGCLYATQTSSIEKVTNADGTCSFAPTTPPGPTATPELGSGDLLATGLVPLALVLLFRRRRRRAD